MIWLIIAAIYAAASIASVAQFWREDSLARMFGRPPLLHYVGFALLWWLIWGGRLAFYAVDEWQFRRESKSRGTSA